MTTDTMPLRNRVAVITGATSGIGLSIARRFAAAGAAVVIASRRYEACVEVAQDLSRSGAVATPVRCDVRIEADVQFLFKSALELTGSVDIVVANAGISGGDVSLTDYDLNSWANLMATNVSGVFLVLREAGRLMSDHGGNVIVISSMAGHYGYANRAPYCASKFAVRGLAYSFAEEMRVHNVGVTCISPDSVDTTLLAHTRVAVEHPLTSDVIADVALFIASGLPNVLIRDIVVERENLA